MSNIENLIDVLESMGRFNSTDSSDNFVSHFATPAQNNQLDDNASIDTSASVDQENIIVTEKNKLLCRLVKIHLRDFFDDIYIPYNHFRKDEWEINKTLYNNDDALFYHREYLTDDDEDKFFQVFDSYILMIEDIMSPSNKLYLFLKKWTDTSSNQWKSFPKKSYLKTLLTDSKYQYISPSYMVNLFCTISKKYGTDSEKIKQICEKKLGVIIKKVKCEIKIFKSLYMEIIRSYVYDCPVDRLDAEAYVKSFVNSIIMTIINFSEKLIELNVYAIHSIINNIISHYIPLDELRNHRPEDFDGRMIYVV